MILSEVQIKLYFSFFFWKGWGSKIQINDYFPTLMLSGWEEIQPTINKRAAAALGGPAVMNSSSQDDG